LCYENYLNSTTYRPALHPSLKHTQHYFWFMIFHKQLYTFYYSIVFIVPNDVMYICYDDFELDARNNCTIITNTRKPFYFLARDSNKIFTKIDKFFLRIQRSSLTICSILNSNTFDSGPAAQITQSEGQQQPKGVGQPSPTLVKTKFIRPYFHP
jgi:hypothetical protein